MPEHDDQPSPRVGTYADLARRMDRIEARHETLEGEVRTLSATVSRMEQNQVHAAELNKLRFDALDTGIKGVGDTLERFMGRINAIISGEVRLPQNEATLADWTAWRAEVDTEREDQTVLNTQVRLLGRLAVIAIGGNALAIAAAVYAALK